MWTDFQVFYQLIRKNMYITQYFHLICNMLVHYRVKLENPKILTILTASATNCRYVPGDILRT